MTDMDLLKEIGRLRAENARLREIVAKSQEEARKAAEKPE